MIDAATDIVCDAGPRIHLDETSCLDLLRDFRKIILPSFVVDEIEKHPPLALTATLPFRVRKEEFQHLSGMTPSPPKEIFRICHHRYHHAGHWQKQC